VKAAAPEPTWAKAGHVRELRLGKPACDHFASRASKAAAPEPTWAKSGAAASYGSASHPAIIIGKDSRKADAVLAPD
jgi:hypothetical protein